MKSSAEEVQDYFNENHDEARGEFVILVSSS